MKEQRYVHQNNLQKLKTLIYLYKRQVVAKNRKRPAFYLFLMLLAIITHSCKNDIEVIQTFAPAKKFPTVSGVNTQIIYSDSGMIKIEIIAPELNKFDNVEEPYAEFPKGIKVNFYDDAGNVQSFISAGYAIYNENERLWEARKNVQAKNFEKGEELNTEKLYWDEQSRMIYSDEFTKITNPDGVFYGQSGFEADQDLSRWKLKSSRGTVNVKDPL